jgi:membrane-associated protease RseP (regulator of RpoE activity)
MTDAPRRPGYGPWLNAALFLATVITTLDAGRNLGEPGGRLITGWPYAAALLAILGAHEFGHWILARRHRVETSLPYFIPVPFGVGTLGAVIRLRGIMPSRRATLDIGVAGPLAGFAVALPLLLWGVAHSTVVDASALPRAGLDSPLALFLAWRDGRLDEIAAAGGGAIQYMGDSLVTWAAQRLTWGELPPGQDLILHPVAFAAWIGMLVTTLNLVPIGQLDGGHLTYALLGQARAEKASRLLSYGLLAAGLFLSWNWLFWWLLTRTVVGVRHPAAWDDRPLDPARTALAVAGLVLFVLTFVPVPFAF